MRCKSLIFSKERNPTAFPPNTFQTKVTLLHEQQIFQCISTNSLQQDRPTKIIAQQKLFYKNDHAKKRVLRNYAIASARLFSINKRLYNCFSALITN